MSFEMTPEMEQVIADLSDGDTPATVMRRAVALLKVLRDAERRGEYLAVIDQHGKITWRIVDER